MSEYLASCKPRLAYKNVDIVVVICTFEELPGRPFSDAFVYQLVNARKVAQCVQDYGHKGTKIIFAGPSAKALAVLLTFFRRFAPLIPTKSLSAVTHMDVVISKSILAAKLKTTTNRIKNLVVWGASHPDITSATIRMYPPGDIGDWEMQDVPVSQVLQDEEWVTSTFMKEVFRKTLHADVLKYGKSLALAIVQHLQYLYFGSSEFDDIPSMMCTGYSEFGYGIPNDYGFSFPMVTENMNWKIKHDMKQSVASKLYCLQTIYHMTEGKVSKSTSKLIEELKNIDFSKTSILSFYNKYLGHDFVSHKDWFVKYFVTQSPGEWVTKFSKSKPIGSKKTIVWGDELAEKSKSLHEKSLIRFSSANLLPKNPERRSGLLKS